MEGYRHEAELDKILSGTGVREETTETTGVRDITSDTEVGPSLIFPVSVE